MAKSWKLSKTFALALGIFLMGGTVLGVSSYTSPAYAQDEEEKTGTLSVAVGRVVQDSYELLQNDDFLGGIQKLENLLSSRGGSMTPYELGTVYELLAGARVNMNPPDYPGALRDFERAINSGGLPTSRTRQIRFNMAQLYFSQDRFQDAINLLEDYIRWAQGVGEEVNANTWYILAAAYYQTERYTKARRPMENALAKSEKAQKSYYELMNAIYVQLGASTAGARSNLLVKMINFWPETGTYWSQLAQVYQSDGKDREAASVLESAYRAGLIKEPGQIRTLIQYYNFLDTPYRGAKLLESEMARGTFKRNVQNLELLAQLWSQAREHKKAIAVLRELASIASDGKYYYRLGQALFADEQWNDAITNLRNGINKGLTSKQAGDSWLLIGTALYSINSDDLAQRNRAREAFRNATNYGGSRGRAQEWISYITQVNLTEQRIREQQEEIARLAAQEELDNCRALIDQANLGAAIVPERLAECRQKLREADAQ